MVKEDDVPRPKCPHIAAENSCTKKRSPVAVSQDKKLGEVQEIYEKLKSTHTGYDQERLRMWAHLIQNHLDEHISDESAMNFGYIEPSKQGVRGKMRWIFTADDLKDMYAAYEQKTLTEVLLWCDGRKVVKEDDVKTSTY